MNNKTIHVLMTGAGAPGAPGIIKCLLQDPSIELTIADADANAVGKHLHSHIIKIPFATDDEFIPTLKQICIKKRITVILPLVTKELFPLSRNKAAFKELGVHVLTSSEEAINIANNKAATYEALKEIELPLYKIVETVEDFKNAATELGYPGKTICFKPSISNGSRGFRIISNETNEYQLLFDQKPNSTLISYPDAVRILSLQPFPQLLVMEYLPGDEYSIDCLAKDGETILCLPRIRQKMINGISVQGQFVNNEVIINYCKKIIKKLHLHGNIGIQVKLSSEGTPLLLEINPRVQGTIVAALGAGINLPLLAVKQELGLPLTTSETTVKWNTSFSRYWTEVYY